MKYKVIDLPDGKSVLVDESAEIKKQDYCDYPPFGIGQIKNIDNELCFVTIPIKSKGSLTQSLYQCKDECQKVIASINHSIDKDVPMVIMEDEVERLALEWCLINGFNPEDYVHSNRTAEYSRVKTIWANGFKAAQQKGVYSEEDLRKAFKAGQNYENLDCQYAFSEYLQSINQKYIDLEGEIIFCHGNGDIDYAIKTNRDSNGQLIAYIKQQILW